MDILKGKSGGTDDAALGVFHKAFDLVAPTVEVRARRVGGSVYQIPAEVRPDRKRALAMKWILTGARARSNKTMSERLAYELIDASEGKGNAIKKKSDVHKMAESNRAFSHYAW
jgi:small subunit ribosomal protein S7